MQPLCDLCTVTVINSSCTEMVTALLFNAVMVRSLYSIMNVPVLALTGKAIPLLKAMNKNYVLEIHI